MHYPRTLDCTESFFSKVNGETLYARPDHPLCTQLLVVYLVRSLITANIISSSAFWAFPSNRLPPTGKPRLSFLSRTNCVSFTALTLFSGRLSRLQAHIFARKKCFPFSSPLFSRSPYHTFALRSTKYILTCLPCGNAVANITAGMKYVTMYHVLLSYTVERLSALIVRRRVHFKRLHAFRTSRTKI